jgi:hypothetical protein
MAHPEPLQHLPAPGARGEGDQPLVAPKPMEAAAGKPITHNANPPMMPKCIFGYVDPSTGDGRKASMVSVLDNKIVGITHSGPSHADLSHLRDLLHKYPECSIQLFFPRAMADVADAVEAMKEPRIEAIAC